MFTRTLLPILIVCALFLLGGCSPQEGVARAQQAVTHADASLVALESLALELRQTKADLQALTDTLGSERTARAIEQADAALADVLAKIPVARDVAAQAKATLAEMETAVAEGGGWGKVALIGGNALLAVLAGMGGWKAVVAQGAKVVLEGQLDRQRAATALAAKHAERMEKAETDADVDKAKAVSLLEQVAAGVHGAIQAARGKAAA